MDNLTQDFDAADFKEGEFREIAGCFYHINGLNPKIAAFDLDKTLTYNCRHLYPQNPDDIYIIPGRGEYLRELVENGYALVVFTNQKTVSRAKKLERVARVKTFMTKLGLPVSCFIATNDNPYRKPDVEMFNLLKCFTRIDEIFFVGDALGRPQDFSDSDKQFAVKAGIEWREPEAVFPSAILPNFVGHKKLVLFVGDQGVGKTRFYNNNLANYAYICQDILKTRPKVMREFRAAIQCEKNICIDATNPTEAGRNEFYEMAQNAGYEIITVFFVLSGYGWNKLRENPVPTMAYHRYYKSLAMPTAENTPGLIFYMY